jgi:hypothetical protein
MSDRKVFYRRLLQEFGRDSAQDVVVEEIAPNDFVATPKEVLKPIHRIVELVRRAEIDFLIFQLVKSTALIGR